MSARPRPEIVLPQGVSSDRRRHHWIARMIRWCNAIPPELAELVSALASFNVGILAAIHVFTAKETPESMRGAADSRTTAIFWAVLFMGFGLAKWTAYHRKDIPARQFVAFVGFFIWSAFSVLVWMSHPEAIFARGVAPVFALTSAVTIFRLGRVTPNGKANGGRNAGTR